MARKFLFLSLVLALFSIQAAAACPQGFPVIVGVPLNADITKIASEAGGCVVDFYPGFILLNLPNAPTHFWDNAITSLEVNGQAKLPSRLDSTQHAIYFQVN